MNSFGPNTDSWGTPHKIFVNPNYAGLFVQIAVVQGAVVWFGIVMNIMRLHQIKAGTRLVSLAMGTIILNHWMC